MLCIRIDQTQHSPLCQQTKRGRYCLCNASVRLNGRERVMSIFNVVINQGYRNNVMQRQHVRSNDQHILHKVK